MPFISLYLIPFPIYFSSIANHFHSNSLPLIICWNYFLSLSFFALLFKPLPFLIFYPSHWHLICFSNFGIIYLQSTPIPTQWQITYFISMPLMIYFSELESLIFFPFHYKEIGYHWLAKVLLSNPMLLFFRFKIPLLLKFNAIPSKGNAIFFLLDKQNPSILTHDHYLFADFFLSLIWIYIFPTHWHFYPLPIFFYH